MSSTDPSTRTPEGEPPSDDDLAHDVALLEALVEEGCAGPLWEQTVRRLTALGIGTLHSLIRGGGCCGRAPRWADRSGWAPRSSRRSTVTTTSAAASSTGKGLDLFRCRTVMGGVWSPAGGARLDTYFVNGCVGALANPVRRWALARRDDPAAPCAPDELERRRVQGDDHADTLRYWEDVETLR